MNVLLTIGEFSKMTHLSVKALRHYHDVGLLEPDVVDPVTGYRRYSPGQVAAAQAVRRFRDLDMPIEDVRAVLGAPDLAQRNRAILVHLERMHRQLDRTQTTVEALAALLTEAPHRRTDVEVRRIPATRALVTRATVTFDACAEWLEPVLDRLHQTADRLAVAAVGADGALYSDQFFQQGEGEVVAFLPVTGDGGDGRDGSDSGLTMEMPPTTAAVLLHHGSFADLDVAYAALGTFVAERGIGGPGPIREHYLAATSTEVCWPVTSVAG